MQTASMPMPKVSIFREIELDIYQWFRVATANERETTGNYIVVDEVIDYTELLLRLGVD